MEQAVMVVSAEVPLARKRDAPLARRKDRPWLNSIQALIFGALTIERRQTQLHPRNDSSTVHDTFGRMETDCSAHPACLDYCGSV
jgi:hypothetical protein